MKVLFDLRVLSDDWSGISVYSFNLLKAISLSNSKIEFILILKDNIILKRLKDQIDDFDETFKEVVFLKSSIYSIKNIYSLNKIIRKNKIDYYFTTQYFWYYGCISAKTIAIIHDIIPMTHPSLLRKSLKTRLRYILAIFTRLTLKLSHKVIVNSDCTLEALEGYFGDDMVKRCVKVYPVLIASNAVKNDDFPLYKRELSEIKNNFLLYVGRHDPYKNLVRLIKAFSDLKKDGFKPQLVIAGRVDTRYPQALKIVKKLKLEEDVIFTNFIEDDILISLYSNCDFVVQPSLLEGFGLTALESLLYNKISIVSDIKVFKEILDKSALFFDPLSIEDIKKAILKAYQLSDKEIEALLYAGKEVKASFSYVEIMNSFESIFS